MSELAKIISSQQLWIVQLLTIILITPAISFVSNRIINFEKKANDNTNWICLLIWPLRSPLKFLIYIIVQY